MKVSRSSLGHAVVVTISVLLMFSVVLCLLGWTLARFLQPGKDLNLWAMLAYWGEDVSSNIFDVFGVMATILLGCVLAIVGSEFSAAEVGDESSVRLWVKFTANLAFAASAPAVILIMIGVTQGPVSPAIIFTVVPVLVVFFVLVLLVNTFQLLSKEKYVELLERKRASSEARIARIPKISPPLGVYACQFVRLALSGVALLAAIVVAPVLSSGSPRIEGEVARAGVFAVALSMILDFLLVRALANRYLAGIGRKFEDGPLYAMLIAVTLVSSFVVSAAMGVYVFVVALLCIFLVGLKWAFVQVGLVRTVCRKKGEGVVLPQGGVRDRLAGRLLIEATATEERYLKGVVEALESAKAMT